MCVKDKKKCLSKIVMSNETQEPIVELTPIGRIIEKQLKWLCEQYEYINIPIYVIMPDHIHFIIEFFTEFKCENRPKVKPLAHLMGALKSTSSKEIHLTGNTNFTWQRNYFDNIIRSENMQNNIFRYIQRNPFNWMNRTWSN